MTPRDGATEFLAQHGWGGASIAPLADDASFRRYFRLSDRGRTAVLMDAPPEKEDSSPFVRMADLLVSAGFSAPRLMAGDLDQGFLLLEDFGDGRVGPLLAARPEMEEELYRRAVDLLVALHHLPPPLELKPYDRDALATEVLVFHHYYLAATGIEADAGAYLAAWDDVWGDVVDDSWARPVVTLRDYHVDNLMHLPDRSGVQALGLLDFQDALSGHRAYDLVSLLQDARRAVSPRLERAMLAHFLTAADVDDQDRFRAAYEVLGAQRNVKILGVFVRLRDRDGRSGYVERLPLVWDYIDRNFAHPALAPVKAWFDDHLPEAARAARWR